MTDTSNDAPAGGAISDEVLSGAEAIAAFMFGDRTLRRKIYYLVEKHALPVFRIGLNICIRKSKLAAWIAERERSAHLPG